jgi:hypothetical protein
MSFPVSIEAQNGHFVASLVGVPGLRVIESTYAQALASLRAAIQHRITQGELVALEIDSIGVSTLAGKYKDDPTLREICEEAYKLRDTEAD